MSTKQHHRVISVKQERVTFPGLIDTTRTHGRRTVGALICRAVVQVDTYTDGELTERGATDYLACTVNLAVGGATWGGGASFRDSELFPCTPEGELARERVVRRKVAAIKRQQTKRRTRAA